VGAQRGFVLGAQLPRAQCKRHHFIARLVGKREFRVPRSSLTIHGLVGAVPWVEMGARYGPWREPTLS